LRTGKKVQERKMSKVKILIVEDDSITAEDIERALQYFEYEVTAIAKSGSGAFSQIKKDTPDLVLMDVKLPGKMDGIEVADQIRTKFNIPVVYLTASADNTTLDRIKKTSPFGFVTKPFDNKELQGVIETALSKHQMEMKIRENEKNLSIRNQQYETFFENDLFGVWRVDFKEPVLTTLSHKKIATEILETGYIAECNDHLLDMWGFKSKNEFVGKPIKELVVDREAFLKKLAKVAKNDFRAEMVDTEEMDSKGSIHHLRNSYFGYVHNQRLHWLWGFQIDITERKKVETVLKESEKKCRNIIESSPMGMHMYTLQPDGKLIFSGGNPAADTILGVDNNQFIGKTIEEAFPPLQATEVPERYRVAALKGEPWKTEQISYEDEQIKGAFEVHAFQTSPNEMTAIFLDITERKKTEEALLSSEERFKELADMLPEAIFETDTNLKLIFTNRRAFGLFGYSAEDLIKGLNGLEMLVPGDRDRAKANIAMRVKGEDPGIVEYQALKKDGSTFPVLFHASSIMKEGKLSGFRGIIVDITERRRAEKALEQNEKLLSQIAENFPNSYLSIIERDLTVGFTSGQEFKKQNLNPEQFIGLTLEQVFGDKTAIVRQYYEKTFKGEECSFELFINNQHQYYRTVPLYADDGDIPRILAVVENITERKKAEEQIKKDLKEKQVLLKEIYHRVKNNLQVISSLLGLQASYIEDKQALEMFKESRDRVRSMALIHEELYRSKEFSNIDFGKYIKNLTGQLVKTYIIDSGRIDLDCKFEDVSLGMVQAVPCGLVINELVSNALKHAFPPSFEGKGKIEITLRSMEAGEIELIVRDNGVGIPKELDIRKTESLGMHLVTLLTEDQLEGQVKLDRSRGTKFTIRFKQENS